MARFFRPEFDRNREFVVNRELTVGGRKLPPGHPLDKTHFTVRRLRQMYDLRIVGFAPEQSAEAKPNSVETATVVKPNGVAARKANPNSNRQRLQGQADARNAKTRYRSNA